MNLLTKIPGTNTSIHINNKQQPQNTLLDEKTIHKKKNICEYKKNRQ
jgi:hypothetical protein